MTPKRKRKVHKLDAQGRPVEVTFDGDPASQCPGCLSQDVQPFRAVGLVPIGDRPEDFVPVRRMRCLGCGARWWRKGV